MRKVWRRRIGWGQGEIKLGLEEQGLGGSRRADLMAMELARDVLKVREPML